MYYLYTQNAYNIIFTRSDLQKLNINRRKRFVCYFSLCTEKNLSIKNLDQGKNPKLQVSLYYHSNFSVFLAPAWSSNSNVTLFNPLIT